MKADMADKIAVLKKSSEFAHLADNALTELVNRAVTCSFQKGEYIFREEDSSAFYYVVRSGRVKLFKQSISGKQIITRFALPGYPLNAIVLFTDSPHFVSAVALGDTTVLRIEKSAYLSFAHRYPSHMLRIIARSEKTLHGAWERLIDAVAENAKQRVLNVLYALYKKHGATLDFTCLEIGELSGTTTESAIRIIGELASVDVVRHTRGTIRITNPDELGKSTRKTFDI